MTDNEILRSFPFTLSVEANISSRTLIYAGSMGEAAEILEERLEELQANLLEAAHLPKEGEPGHDHIFFEFDVNQAMGYEVAGTNRLIPGLTTLDIDGVCTCDHTEEDHA